MKNFQFQCLKNVESIYMPCDIHSNLVMKVIEQICRTPSYIDVKVSIKPNWQGFVKLANKNQNNQLQRDEFEKNHHMENFK